MTSNKPEVVAYRYTASRSFGKRNPKWHYQESFPHAENRKVEEIGRLEKLIRISDYEALQAECDSLRKHLQNLIDQTTPLEPVPGNPMWSRRIQLDEVMAERDSLRAECEKLRERDALLVELLEICREFIDPPERNCSCHISPPCSDCVDHSFERDLLESIDAAMQRAQP